MILSVYYILNATMCSDMTVCIEWLGSSSCVFYERLNIQYWLQDCVGDSAAAIYNVGYWKGLVVSTGTCTFHFSKNTFPFAKLNKSSCSVLNDS